MKYPLATPTWDQREYDAMQRVIDRGMFTMGEEVRAFETQFATIVGSRYAVMVNSGSSANLLMMAAMLYRNDGALATGAEIIVPAVSWSTTYTPLQQLGYRVRFVDVDSGTLNIDEQQVEAAVTKDTRAILAVNLLGNPAPLEQLSAIAQKHSLILLEDNCESLGASVAGKQTGTWGVMGTFSFFFSHHISTMEGGAVVTEDEELYHILLSLRAHGWTRQLPRENRLVKKQTDGFFESFRFVLPGFNVRPLELSGAIGRVQLQKLPMFIKQRRRNAEHFVSLFREDPRFRIQSEHGQSSWFGFSLIVRDESLSRDAIVKTLANRDIECRPVVAGNFLRNPVMRYFDYSAYGNCPVADDIHEHGLFVGNSHEDIREQIDHLRRILA